MHGGLLLREPTRRRALTVPDHKDTTTLNLQAGVPYGSWPKLLPPNWELFKQGPKSYGADSLYEA